MNDWSSKAETIKSEFDASIQAIKTLEELDRLRVRFLGKRGDVTQLLRALGSLPKEERPLAGEQINVLKEYVEACLQKRAQELQGESEILAEKRERIDVTLPGCGRPAGTTHPVVQTMMEVIEIFVGLGFSVASGPEIETDYFNFEALNFKPYHPARDMQDTFYVTGSRLLRTHTSPVQVRAMQEKGAPLRIICPGRVYRRDSDPTHSPMFHQLEGLLVDEDVSIADLKGCLEVFVKAIFGRPLKMRYRASYFPFTEPSIEVDIECVSCAGRNSDCRVCKGTGWLEILGAGMVHPNVLMAGGVDPTRYNGFAWGMGIDRVAMLKYNLTDLRPLFEGDLTFLSSRS